MTEDWQQIGRHQLRVEGDIFLSRWFGTCTIEELNEFLARIEVLLPGIRHPFLLIDNTHAAPGRPDVRRRLFEWARTHSIDGGVVIFGLASAATRAIAMLLINAISLIKGNDLRRRAVFLRDEVEARAFVERRRAELQAADRV